MQLGLANGGQAQLGTQHEVDCNISVLLISFLVAFEVGGLGFEFCVFVAGWRHALRREWHFFSN